MGKQLHMVILETLISALRISMQPSTSLNSALELRKTWEIRQGKVVHMAISVALFNVWATTRKPWTITTCVSVLPKK